MFWLLSFLPLLGTSSAIPTPHQAIERDIAQFFTLQDAEAFAPATELKVTDNVVSLKKSSVTRTNALLSSLSSGSGTTSLLPVESGAGYAIDVGLGGKTFEAIIDTGSSDLWIFKKGVKCVGEEGAAASAASCAFGPEFSGTFQDGTVADENFNITYGDGEFTVGTLGYEDVTVAGVTVDHQEMALISEAYWEGDGVTSGIIGFAYSSLTSAYTGTNPAADNPDKNNVHYTNWVDNAIKQKKFSPMFSLAIERGKGGGGGQLALGGLPSVSFQHDFVSTPLKIVQLTPLPIEKKELSYYTIIPDGVVIDGKTTSTQTPMIVDSGTTLLYLPTKLAEEINKAYSPASILDPLEGVYVNSCDAKPPTVAISIGGKEFTISPDDLLLKGQTNLLDLCATGVQPGPDGLSILGDVFLKNVVAVFDIGSSEMKFAPHVY